MTREKRPAAAKAARRAASLLTGALMVAGLAGCGNSLLQGDTSASLAPKAKPTVAFSPIQGVPQKYAAKVGDKLASSMTEKGVKVADAKDAEYIVKAAYIAMPEAKKGTKLTYALDVTDKAGNRVRRIEGEELVSPKRGGDSWSHVTDDAVDKVTLKSASDLNAWIDNPNAPSPAPAAMAAAAPAPSAKAPVAVKAAAAKSSKPVPAPALAAAVSADPATEQDAAPPVRQAALSAKNDVAAVVPAVTGAPGDGRTALADGMKKALTQNGVKLASSAAGAYKVQGQVEMGTAANGVQPITIRWFVIDPSGKQLEKTVVQNNKVDEGRLDKNWGDIADQASAAAAQEISKLLAKTATGQVQPATAGSAG